MCTIMYDAFATFPHVGRCGPPKKGFQKPHPRISKSLELNWAAGFAWNGGDTFGLDFQTQKINLAAKNDWYFTNFFFCTSRHDITVQKAQYGSSGSQNASLFLQFEACCTFEPNGTRLTIDNWSSLSSERLSKIQHNRSSMQSSLGFLPTEMSILSAAICTWRKLVIKPVSRHIQDGLVWELVTKVCYHVRKTTLWQTENHHLKLKEHLQTCFSGTPANKKHQTTKRCDLPTTYEIDSMLRKTIPTNERVKLFWTHFIPSLVLFHVSRGNCIQRRLCAIWTPAMRELERSKLLSIWSLTIIATHSKWNVQTTCAHM